MTRRMRYESKERPELDALIKRASAAYDAMAPGQQAEHRRAQRKSWVVGEMMLQHPGMTREQAERIYADIDD